ncbi:MAG: hypothetical protein AAFN07_12005 [Pseudomonadota bacterium]
MTDESPESDNGIRSTKSSASRRLETAAGGTKRVGSAIKTGLEFFGRHPLITGILGILGILGLLLSIQSYRIDRSEARETTSQIDQIIESTRFVPDCEDRDVYLQVMAAARQLPDPYSQWTLRGSTGNKINIERGTCSMVLLFVTGHPRGLMTEVNVTYVTAGEVAIRSVNAIKTPSDDKTKMLLSADGQSTVHSIVGSKEPEWFYVDVEPGRKVRLEVGPDFKNVAATVIGVGDMRQDFEFVATEARYEFFVAQLFRSVGDEDFWVRVEVH